MQMTWLPVHRSWRLNERHYGALQGLDQAGTAELHGAEKVKIWRRSYDERPPEHRTGQRVRRVGDPRYRELPPHVIPLAECLKDTLERTLPYWDDDIVPDLRAGASGVVAAHGNSLRALVKHLDNNQRQRHRRPQHPDRKSVGVRARRRPVTESHRYLDPEAAAAGMAEVAAQAADAFSVRFASESRPLAATSGTQQRNLRSLRSLPMRKRSAEAIQEKDVRKQFAVSWGKDAGIASLLA